MGSERHGEDFGSFAAARIPALVRYGVALTGSRADAEDLVQEALVRLATRWHAVADRGSPDAYVRKVMTNLHVSWWRSRRRELLHPTPPDAAVTDTLPNRDLWVALRALPPRQRAVVALRYLEDLTEAETAQILGCSVGTVKSQNAKALARLRPHLAEPTFMEAT
jgi:RNA polymerase sigma-70 factor (sigma-E family)